MSYYTSYWTVDKFVSYRKKNFYLHNNDPKFFVANKELPLGTRIKIVAKESGKEVFANVTDYGPVGGCIDASYWTFGTVCDHDAGRCAVDMYKLRAD
jgi:rare lipoprotein A (peptidoglycan hydrolase)